MARWLDALRDWYVYREPERGMTTFTGRLPSSLPEAFFDADFTVIWPVAGYDIPTKLETLVERRVREIAGSATRGHSVLSPGEARSAANLALLNAPPVTDDARAPLSAEVRLTAEEGGRQMAEEHATLRRTVSLAQAEHEAKLERLGFLRDRVLRDPVTTSLWWLDDRLERLPEVLGLAEQFERSARLFAEEAAGSRPDPTGRLVGDLLSEFLRGLEPEHHALLLKQLGHVFSSFERDDLAKRLDER